MTKQMTVSETLNRAADLIEERGWIAGEGWEHEQGGPLCLEGGILAAIGGSFMRGDHYRCPAYRAVTEYLKHRTNKAPFLWNDLLASDRVAAAIQRGECFPENLPEVRAEAAEWAKAEVISVLRAAALIEAAKETDVRVVSPC
jgi:hypothetical protein